MYAELTRIYGGPTVEWFYKHTLGWLKVSGYLHILIQGIPPDSPGFSVHGLCQLQRYRDDTPKEDVENSHDPIPLRLDD